MKNTVKENIKTFLIKMNLKRIGLIKFFDTQRLNQFDVVKFGLKKLYLADFGYETRRRSTRFLTKEPETLEWIDNFDGQEVLLDIGANIGSYSLYAALNGHKVVAIEPEALNFALLVLNIKKNNFENLIIPYPIAIHDREGYSTLNCPSLLWGGSEQSFDNDLNTFQSKIVISHRQGVFGSPLDNFLSNIKFEPDHVKIDVDGNELLVLRGAKDYIANSKKLKSIMIELCETRSDYNETCELLTNSGFILQKIFYTRGEKRKVNNHLFKKEF